MRWIHFKRLSEHGGNCAASSWLKDLPQRVEACRLVNRRSSVNFWPMLLTYGSFPGSPAGIFRRDYTDSRRHGNMSDPWTFMQCWLYEKNEAWAERNGATYWHKETTSAFSSAPQGPASHNLQVATLFISGPERSSAFNAPMKLTTIFLPQTGSQVLTAKAVCQNSAWKFFGFFWTSAQPEKVSKWYNTIFSESGQWNFWLNRSKRWF